MAERVDVLKAVLAAKGGIARSNLFAIELPEIAGANVIKTELDYLCTNVQLPGKQILTQERLIGVKAQKMPTGYVADDINLTFYCLNDYGVKNYFEKWQDLVINPVSHALNYKTVYARDVKIKQLTKDVRFDFPIDISLGLIDIDIDVGSANARERPVYTVRLIDAFPTSISSIEMSGDLDGLIQLQVQLSYSRWLPDLSRVRIPKRSPTRLSPSNMRPRARPTLSLQ